MKKFLKFLSIIALVLVSAHGVYASILTVPAGGTGANSIVTNGIVYGTNATTGPLITDNFFTRQSGNDYTTTIGSDGLIILENLIGKRIATFSPTAGAVLLGDIDHILNNTVVTLNDPDSLFTVNGNNGGVGQSAVVFAGSGDDDLTVDGSAYSGMAGVTFNLTITAVNNQFINYVSLAGGTFGIGDTITVTSGPDTGNSGTVVTIVSPNEFILTDLTGPFGIGDSFDNGMGVSADWNDGGSVYDAYSWTSSDGGSGTGDTSSVTPVTLTDNVTVIFGSATGHVIGDHWDWGYAVQYGKMLSLDGQNHIFQIGDVDDVGLGTVVKIDDSSQQISFQYGLNGSYIFPTGNSAGALVNDGSGTLTWTPTVGGSITDGQVGYGNSSNLLTSDSNFLWDASHFNFYVGDLALAQTHTRFSVENSSGSISANSPGGNVYLGDNGFEGNSTFFQVNDLGSSIFGQFAQTFTLTDPSGLRTLFRVDNAASLVRIGDLTNQNNGTYASVDDANQIFEVVGKYNSISGSPFIFANFSTGSLLLGDVGGSRNNTQIFIDDQNTQTVTAGGKFAGISFGNMVVADFPNGRFTAGDTGAIQNSTVFSVDDGFRRIRANTNGRFVVATTANSEWMSVTTTAGNGAVGLGDLSSMGNGTKQLLDDSTGMITFVVPTEYDVKDTSGNVFLSFNPATQLVKLGDVSGAFNDTRIEVDDANQLININNTGVTGIGDTANIGNKTSLFVDDTVKDITAQVGRYFLINSTGNDNFFRVDTSARLINIGDLGAFNGTNITVDDATFRTFVANRFETAKGAAVTAANNLVLGGGGNTFEIQGNTQINLMSNTNWQTGSKVTLYVTGNPLIKNNQTGSGANVPLILQGGQDIQCNGSQVLSFVYMGGSWLQYIPTVDSANPSSGSTTPTLTNVTNVTSSTAHPVSWSRTGNVVTVFGSLDVTTTLAVATEVDISLPIASNLAASTDANGVGQATSAIGTNIYSDGDATNNRVRLKFIGLSVGGAGTIFFSFNYNVI